MPFIHLALLLLSFLGPTIALGSDHPPVRVTTGIVETSGWQNNLVKRNPSLKHWHWSPIYSYQQALVGSSHPANLANQNNPKRVVLPTHQTPSPYLKPIHIPFNVQAAPASRPTAQAPNDAIAAKVAGKIKPSYVGQDNNSSDKQLHYQYNYDNHAPAKGTNNLQALADVHGQLRSKPVKALRATPKALSNDKAL